MMQIRAVSSGYALRVSGPCFVTISFDRALENGRATSAHGKDRTMLGVTLGNLVRAPEPAAHVPLLKRSAVRRPRAA